MPNGRRCPEEFPDERGEFLAFAIGGGIGLIVAVFFLWLNDWR